MAARGIGAINQAIKNISGGGKGSGRRFSYFNLADGEEMFVRFLTDQDEIITCGFYEYVKVKHKKDNKWTDGVHSFIIAPDYYEGRPDVSDWVLKYGGKTENYNTKELEDPKPKERSVAIAVERERVALANSGGRPKFKYQDKIVEVTYKDKDGNEKTYKGRNFILIRKDAKTFWSNIVGYFSEYGTFCDRDYKITRNGERLATNFTITPVGQGEEWEDIDAAVKELQAEYGYGGKDADGNEIAADSDERFMYCPQTLDEWCIDQAREELAKGLILGESTSQNTGSSTKGSDEFHKDSSWNAGDDEAQTGSSQDGDIARLRSKLEAFA